MIFGTVGLSENGGKKMFLSLLNEDTKNISRVSIINILYLREKLIVGSVNPFGVLLSLLHPQLMFGFCQWAAPFPRQSKNLLTTHLDLPLKYQIVLSILAKEYAKKLRLG